jgi:hypothetical protein
MKVKVKSNRGRRIEENEYTEMMFCMQEFEMWYM